MNCTATGKRRVPMAKKWLSQLYVQVLAGILVGGAIGLLSPEIAVALQPLADAFIKLIKMLLAPIIFGTVVLGIARMGDIKEVGRIGVRALIYFEIVSTLALVLGLVVVNVMQPGVGMNVDAAGLNTEAIKTYQSGAAEHQDAVSFLMNIIPTTMTDAFAKGAMLQVILISALTGVALVSIGQHGKPLIEIIDSFLQVQFRIVGMIMRLAPIGAGAGVAYTIGKYGIGALWSFAHLILAVYLTSALFIVIVIGGIARWCRFPLLHFLRYFKDELLITFATCSTEAVLPRVMAKLERIGCAKPVVGLVVPAGYTFNADGTCIYLTMAAIFIAQATNTHLTLWQQITILGILLLTSKGSAGVAGAGFVTLAATLSSIDSVPASGLVLLLGVDRFLNEARAVTNLIGNGVATIAIAKWEGLLDQDAVKAVIAEQKGRPSAQVRSTASASTDDTADRPIP